jgi:guanylate kinase
VRIWDEYARDGGLLIVLSGPSGVGKDALLDEFLTLGTGVKKCVTCTTRPKREGEVDGVDYTFLAADAFVRMKSEGGFLESAVYCGNMYGTPGDWVERENALGHDVVLKIEVQGGLEVKRQKPDCVMVFLVPPSMEELERRLRDRLTESDVEIEGRLARARKELELVSNYEYIIENDSLHQAAEELKSIVTAEHDRIRAF